MVIVGQLVTRDLLELVANGIAGMVVDGAGIGQVRESFPAKVAIAWCLRETP